MFPILDNFKKIIEVEGRESAPHQIVAVGVHWNRHIEQLIKEFMNDPYIVITAMEEAALYGSVQQVKSPGCVWWGVGEPKQVTFIHGLILKDYSINFIYNL